MFEIAKYILPSVILPVWLVYLNNRNTKAGKEIDAKLQIDKIKEEKKILAQGRIEDEKRLHEKSVYSSLLKILFEIQLLHIELSGNCVNYDCIKEATEKFKKCFSDHQSKISDDQIHLSAEASNILYGFYQDIGDLLIQLKEIQDQAKFNLAIAAVYFMSQNMAMKVLVLKLTCFDENKLETVDEAILQREHGNFINCCGQRPKREIVEEYQAFESAGEILMNQSSHQISNAL